MKAKSKGQFELPLNRTDSDSYRQWLFERDTSSHARCLERILMQIRNAIAGARQAAKAR